MYIGRCVMYLVDKILVVEMYCFFMNWSEYINIDIYIVIIV